MNRDETMTTSSTGGMKGSKLAQLSAIDPQALLAVAECAGAGARKYSRHNYLKGYDWSLSMDALMRHALQFQAGEDYDPESGLPHMAHAAWHAMTLVSFLLHGLGTDDRASTQLEGVKPLSVEHGPEPETSDDQYGRDLNLLKQAKPSWIVRDSEGVDWQMTSQRDWMIRDARTPACARPVPIFELALCGPLKVVDSHG